jgi:hypothetical protein
MMMEQMRLFDDSTLDTEARIVVQQRTGEIRSLMRRAAQDSINFARWLRVEFDWSESTALKAKQPRRCATVSPEGVNGHGRRKIGAKGVAPMIW